MAKYLQLYLDTDFIIPIGVGDSGHFNKYTDQHASRRRWLYFSHASSGSSTFDSSETNKACYEAGKENYFGDFWKHVEQNDVVPGEKFTYLDLLDLSRIISDLREWAQPAIGTDSPELVLNFSTVIPMKARRNFANYIQDKIGTIRSFSIELNDLLASKIQSDYKTLAPEFGDQLLIIQSTGQDILMSVMTWCGDRYMQGEEPVRLAKQGSEFLKRALAKMVVDNYNRTHSMLRQDQIEQEYAYQMQFADQWLAQRKGDSNFWIENFHFSTNPTKVYAPIQIDGTELNLIEQEAIRNTISAISKFYKENIINRHLHTILVGDIFKEEVFLKNCVSVTSSDGKYTFFNDNAIQEALGRYGVDHSVLSENLQDLERLYLDKANERNRICTYVHNAEQLGKLRDLAASAKSQLTKSINDINERNQDLVASWESYMRISDFNNARNTIDEMSVSDLLLQSKNEAMNSLKQIEQYNSMLIELTQLAEVKPIIDLLRSDEKNLRELVEKANELHHLPDTLREKTQKYQDCYGKYCELRRQFNNETSLVIRKKLVEEMAPLTMEPMPATEVEGVTGKITVTSETAGGFLGFGAKKQITVKLHVDKALPCPGVLVISPKVITNIPEDRYNIYAVDVEKGESGDVLCFTAEPKDLGLDKKATKLYIKFWPHENEVISPNSFTFSGSGYVNI